MTVTSPRPQPGVLKIAPYKQGQSTIDGIANPIKLSSNESPLGPSPKAIAAYDDAVKRLFRYPDGSQTDLREAIADVFGLDPARIICGNGSDEVIQLVIRAYVGVGDEVILSQYAFAMCRVHALAQGAEVITAPEPDCRVNVDEILARVTPKTRLIAFASPNNPCGTYLAKADLKRLHEALPPHVILLVDAAYADYVVKPDYSDGLGLAAKSSNIIVTHTFSKLYGLSALRIGWGYAAPEMIELMNRIRTPFNTNDPALAAAAAAVRDQDYAAMVRAHNNDWLARMTTELEALDLDVVPSVANFLLIQFPSEEKSAERAWEFLLSRGIIPRPVNAGGPDNCLRVTIGLAHENEAFLAAMRDFMK
ncbi:histidinol-phosphate transaminase [Govanella unica]|uniref:Histidinol-phosphate aminotransferase n=1 Tax=Govanella unica TaxID=2975056 RepID=A0A9X3Z692_9PROT|nr:histidinol-phosphate transaminase [Govania unica]MDA5192694.1 histidinol-phosphate transaminase [Govania unica]